MNPPPLIDPRLHPHLDALLDAADEVIEDWRCNDVEDGDALIACGLLVELRDAVEALRANLDRGELLPAGGRGGPPPLTWGAPCR